jgi:hypothetical protein
MHMFLFLAFRFIHIAHSHHSYQTPTRRLSLVNILRTAMHAEDSDPVSRWWSSHQMRRSVAVSLFETAITDSHFVAASTYLWPTKNSASLIPLYSVFSTRGRNDSWPPQPRYTYLCVRIPSIPLAETVSSRSLITKDKKKGNHHM